MPRRETKPARREEPRRGGKPRGLLLGLVIGLVIGLVAAAGLTWYFNMGERGFKAVEPAPRISHPTPIEQPAEPEKEASPRRGNNAPQVGVKPAKPVKAHKHAAPVAAHKVTAASEPTSRVPLTFYGILPGDKPAKPVEPPKSTEIWWLQIAALKNPADADRLKARLSLLGLRVSTQQIESAGQSLYRVRVGPYKRDEDAFADLDTLSANSYEPRLLKEPVKGVSP